MPRVLSAMLIVSALLAVLLGIAANLARVAAAAVTVRTDFTLAERQAADEYGKARIRCELQSSRDKESCVAEAHAAEGRARTVAQLSQGGYRATLRSRTDAGIDAGGTDSIVNQPMCEGQPRGQREACEMRPDMRLVRTIALGARKSQMNPRMQRAASGGQESPQFASR
jgi:hypothetical protein